MRGYGLLYGRESEEDTECGESESDNHVSIKKRAMKNKKKKQEVVDKEEAVSISYCLILYFIIFKSDNKEKQ